MIDWALNNDHVRARACLCVNVRTGVCILCARVCVSVYLNECVCVCECACMRVYCMRACVCECVFE